VNAGHFPVPLKPRSKKILEEGWPEWRITAGEVPHRFQPDSNVGILTGVTRLIDVDLDCKEAIALADNYLPETGWVWGRIGAPRSHRLYLGSGEIPLTEKFPAPNEPEEGMLVELRTTGHQTLYPGSVHPSGERIRWFEHTQPSEVDPPTLVRAVSHLAAASLIARNWNKGSRDEIAAALIGVLDSCGWSSDEIELFLKPIVRYVGDEEAQARLSKIRRTPGARAAGRRIYGFPTLVEKLGQDVVRKMSEWLELNENAA
jgi:hypothetical protein